MKMLLKDGSVIEGTPITDEDVRNSAILKSEIKAWSRDSGNYVSYDIPEKMARFLVINYEIKKRGEAIVLADENPGIEEVAYPAPKSLPLVESPEDGPSF